MEKKVYLVYASSRGSKDLVYCTIDKANAFDVAASMKREAERKFPNMTINYRVYSMPLHCCY